MTNLEINKIYSPEISPNAPYGVEILIGCSPTDPDVGSSEMSWYTTEAEQQAYYNEMVDEYKEAN